MSIFPEMLLEWQKQLEQDASKESAWKIIEEYYSFFSVKTIRHDLWQLLMGALCNDESMGLETGRDRHNLVFFYEYTLMLIDAVATLNNHRKQKHF